MTRKVRQEALFTGDVRSGDTDSPAVRSSAKQAKPSVGNVVNNIITLTQVEYDAITVPDSQTVCIIAG